MKKFRECDIYKCDCGQFVDPETYFKNERMCDMCYQDFLLNQEQRYGEERKYDIR
jgi:hypothetical protein